MRDYCIIVCFDSPSAVLKARANALHPKPLNQPSEDFKDLPHVKKAAKILRVSGFDCVDHEADDLISTLAVQLDPFPVFIMSTDRDFYQLVDDRVKILKGARLGQPDMVTAEDIRNRYSVTYLAGLFQEGCGHPGSMRTESCYYGGGIGSERRTIARPSLRRRPGFRVFRPQRKWLACWVCGTLEGG